MAQRGGSVESHLRFGEEVFSPLIPPGQADYLVCFHSEEEQRVRRFLKPDGINFLPFLERAETEKMDKRFLNTYLLGVLSAYLPIQEENWLDALTTVFTRAQETNREIFMRGADFGKNQGK